MYFCFHAISLLLFYREMSKSFFTTLEVAEIQRKLHNLKLNLGCCCSEEVRDYCRSFADGRGTNSEFVLLCLLGYCSALIPGGVFCTSLLGKQMPCSLFLLLVGPPGCGKSVAHREIFEKPVEKLKQRTILEEHVVCTVATKEGLMRVVERSENGKVVIASEEMADQLNGCARRSKQGGLDTINIHCIH